MSSNETLILTDSDVRQLLDINEVMEVVENAFREKGLDHVQMPPKVYLFYERHDGDLRVMPSYLERLEISAVKVVNVHPQNRTRYGLPTVMAVLILVDPKSGFPLAVMSGTWLTAMRTGAAGGIAAKYLARSDSEEACFIGAGTQARTQFMAISNILKNLRRVRVYDISRGVAESFIEYASNIVDYIDFKVCDSPREAVVGSDVIITTTPSRKPIVMSEWMREGVHLNCIGADAPGKEEIDPKILLKAKIVIDSLEQAVHSGEINVPVSQGMLREDNIYGELGEIVAGVKKGRESPDETTVFTSTGLAIQDAATAELAYRRAITRDIGVHLKLVT